jgi:hypothetical protein
MVGLLRDVGSRDATSPDAERAIPHPPALVTPRLYSAHFRPQPVRASGSVTALSGNWTATGSSRITAVDRTRAATIEACLGKRTRVLAYLTQGISRRVFLAL